MELYREQSKKESAEDICEVSEKSSLAMQHHSKKKHYVYWVGGEESTELYGYLAADHLRIVSRKMG